MFKNYLFFIWMNDQEVRCQMVYKIFHLLLSWQFVTVKQQLGRIEIVMIKQFRLFKVLCPRIATKMQGKVLAFCPKLVPNIGNARSHRPPLPAVYIYL